MNHSSHNREAVVLLHGLWMPSAVMSRLGQHLARLSSDRQVHLFGYPSLRTDLDGNIQSLFEFVESIDAETVHLVGHSLGGLLILKMLNSQPPSRVGRVVCLGSPLRGSRAGERLQTLPGGKVVAGKSLAQALDKALPDWKGEWAVGVIAGSMGVGLGRLVDQLEVPNDGTVSVCETRLPGISDHLVLPLNHSGLVFSPEVARQTDYFLSHGSFQRDE
jgi:pimeloyl-ACP methyl ester carboxylesterase